MDVRDAGDLALVLAAVEYGDVVTAFDQLSDDGRADEVRAADHEDAHAGLRSGKEKDAAWRPTLAIQLCSRV